MQLEQDLSRALDEFEGICAVGALFNPKVEAIPAGGYLLPKVTASVYWEKAEYQLELWAGDEAGGPGSEDTMHAWLRLGNETMRLDGADRSSISKFVPPESLSTVMAAIIQGSGMLVAANDALDCAETRYDLSATLERLQAIAASSKHLIEHESESLLAHTDLMFNCMVDLLGNMSIAESTDVHLAFDLMAETIDPASGQKVTIKAGWAKADDASHNYTHAFHLAGRSCQAHDEGDFDRMLADYPESSREHYRHTFTHLHQAAHAVGEYAAGKVGEAIAKAGTVSEPLLHVERHAITHRIHAEVVEELNPFVLKMSGEPGRGQEHRH